MVMDLHQSSTTPQGVASVSTSIKPTPAPIQGHRPHQNGSSMVVLRVKRHRDETPMEHLVVEAAAKRPRGIDALSSQMASLATDNQARATTGLTQSRGGSSTKRFVFKRVDTVDAEASAHLGRRVGKRHLVVDDSLTETSAPMDFEEIRRFRSTDLTGLAASGNGERQGGTSYQLIDLTRAKRVHQEETDEVQPPSATGPQQGSATKAASVKRPVYIFSPLERELDEAIYRAFNGGPTEVQAMMGVIDRGADVNFQRKNADDTTPLMAAAYAGSVHGVSRLLRMGANYRMRDRAGNTALDLAMHKGHKACEILLRQAASVEDGDYEEEGDLAAYVFDVYMLGDSDAAVDTATGTGTTATTTPVVRVDGLGYVEGQDEAELVFEDDSDWSDGGGDDDVDSNSEGYYANDYPEDPSSEEGSEDEDRRRGMGGEEEEDYDEEMIRDLGFRMNEASRRHIMEDLRGSRGSAMGGGIGGPFYSGMGFRQGVGIDGELSSDEEYGDVYGGGGSDDDRGLGRFNAARYRTTAYDPDLDDDEDDY